MGRTRRSHRPLAVALVALTVSVSWPTVAHAEPGDLDATYGTCGVTGIPIRFGFSPGNVVTQSDGRVLQLRFAQTKPEVTRWLANGRLDRAYGTGGTLTLPKVDDQIASLTLDPQDRLLVVDRKREHAGGGGVIRVTKDGHLDATFGNGGIVKTPWFAAKPAHFSDGSIVFITDHRGARRYTAAGQVDPTWNPAPLPPGTPLEDFHAAAALTDDDYLVASETVANRFRPNGGIHSSFPRIVIPSVPGVSNLVLTGTSDVIALPDSGALLVGGYVANVSGQGATGGVAVRRIVSDGSLHAGFGTDGVTLLDFGRSPHSLVSHRESNGRVWVAAGFDGPLADGHRYVIMAVLMPDGSLDPSFAGGGILRIRDGWNALGIHAGNRGVTLGVVAPGNLMLVSLVLRFRRDSLTTGAGLVLDWSGTVWPTRFGNGAPPPCPLDTPLWPNADLARGVTAVRGKGGYVVDAFGGLHAFSLGPSRPAAARAIGGPYWPGWDIVRGVAARADGRAGYVLDGWGGLHRFRTPGNALPAVTRHGPYWRGFDIARDVALMPDGRSGFVLDGYGGLHPFRVGAAPLPPRPRFGPYWYGWDIARGVSILPDGTGGYVLDGYGGVHPFALGNHAPPPKPGPGAPYDTSDDWARGFAFVPPITGPTDAPAATATDARASTDIATLDDAVLRLTRRPSSPPRR